MPTEPGKLYNLFWSKYLKEHKEHYKIGVRPLKEWMEIRRTSAPAMIIGIRPSPSLLICVKGLENVSVDTLIKRLSPERKYIEEALQCRLKPYAKEKWTLVTEANSAAAGFNFYDQSTWPIGMIWIFDILEKYNPVIETARTRIRKLMSSPGYKL